MSVKYIRKTGALVCGLNSGREERSQSLRRWKYFNSSCKWVCRIHISNTMVLQVCVSVDSGVFKCIYVLNRGKRVDKESWELLHASFNCIGKKYTNWIHTHIRKSMVLQGCVSVGFCDS